MSETELRVVEIPHLNTSFASWVLQIIKLKLFISSISIAIDFLVIFSSLKLTNKEPKVFHWESFMDYLEVWYSRICTKSYHINLKPNNFTVLYFKIQLQFNLNLKPRTN